MVAYMCVICEECLTIALNSPCECGRVATKASTGIFSLIIYSNTSTNTTLGKAWVDDNGIITYFRRYKDIHLAKVIPITVKGDDSELS